jgi:hypothetical protein
MLVRKEAARHKVDNAIYNNKMERLSCVICGEENADGHHESYSPNRRLDVIS